ncbi:MAG: thioredoxin family protein [Imperialibacter sp.]
MKKTISLIVLLAIVQVSAAPFDGGYEVGDIARDFQLKNVDGASISLSDYKEAKGFIVVFTCNTCPYAKLYEQRIIALDKKYKGAGYPVIAIQPNDGSLSPGDSFEATQANSKKKGFSFPYLLDETQEIARAYGAARTPHVFLLNKESGKLRVAYIGASDNNHPDSNTADKKYVEDAVDALIAAKKVPVTLTKAIGCTIKWSGT